MTNDALHAALGAPPPRSFQQLRVEERELLAYALQEERAAQNEGLEEAAEEALELVPPVLRGPVRRILLT